MKDDSSHPQDPADGRPITVGICAMAKKSRSLPMREILSRLERFECITIVIFDEDVILHKPVEEWPLCDCLVSFNSHGFPLDKAMLYAALRKPMMINELSVQYILQDRCLVHEILAAEGIEPARYATLDRDSGNPDECRLVESEDQIEVNGEVFTKPFVEKPVSAEDHNVYIYFPTSAGGGSQRLFRKVGNKCSSYSPESQVRKTGSYIYEEFIPADGRDIKVYTVGPDYAYAEARKSPALDGKVERDQSGKEVRYPVFLSADEKLIAKKVCLAFKQMVCTFDLLRANGKSYVCDVDGFSLVKNSTKYCDDSAKILGHLIMQTLAPQMSIPWSLDYQPEDIPIVPTTKGTRMELRCVIGVIRHGDRTPKQKMKMEVTRKEYFDLFEKYDGYKTGEVKLKKPKQLQDVLDTTQLLLNQVHGHSSPDNEEMTKLEQLKAVLEMYGHFSGMNQKVQMKYQAKAKGKKKTPANEGSPYQPSLQLIVKWGGTLTPAGQSQAEDLGKAFRSLYHSGQEEGDDGSEGENGNLTGLEFLRLHCSYRQDLKIYASDEGRVQMTAAAFVKGLLDLEGELTPILIQTIKSANMNGLLENENDSPKYQNEVKNKLKKMMNQRKDFSEEDYEQLAATAAKSLVNAMNDVMNPHDMCQRVYNMITELCDHIAQLYLDPNSTGKKLYCGESWELMLQRWRKLQKDFTAKNEEFDISKVSDIYDCIKYDVQHNMRVLQYHRADKLYSCAKTLADIVVPQEYGITRDEKMTISCCICTPLIRKLLADLQVYFDDNRNMLKSGYFGEDTAERNVKTRLYFTSEGHIHSVLNLLRYGDLVEDEDEQWVRAMEYVSATPELNYMTQIVIMLYEDPTKDPGSNDRHHVELHFSPGAYTKEHEVPGSSGFRPKISDASQQIYDPYGHFTNEGSLQRQDSEVESLESLIDDVSGQNSRASSIADESVHGNLMSLSLDLTQDDSGSDSAVSSETEAPDDTVTDPDSQQDFYLYDKQNKCDDNFVIPLEPHLVTMETDNQDHTQRKNADTVQGLSDKMTEFTYTSTYTSPSHRETDLNKGVDSLGVPSIRPLETLHNELTLKQMVTFLKTITDAE